MRVAVAFLTLFAVATARMAYVLPLGAEELLRARALTTSFSCEGLPYGYYADMDNHCEIFHVCEPIEDAEGNVIRTEHYSFVCNNMTIFDQRTLGCASESDALPCDQASSFYERSNAEFGRIPEPVVGDNALFN